MGKFDGILLCSDWDGTLMTSEYPNPRDVEAIRYFQENGGAFTICTGRDLPYMLKYFDQIKPNTYLICLNGAKICHPETSNLLYEGFLDEKIVRILDEIFISDEYFDHMTLYYENRGISNLFSPSDYVKLRSKIFDTRVYKVLLYAKSSENALAAQAKLLPLKIDDYVYVRSWDTSLEILRTENAKGAAIRRLAAHIGATKTVAVGDFENDILMIEAADIGYAVGGAAEALKKVADRITVPAPEGAIAKIIQDLDMEL